MDNEETVESSGVQQLIDRLQQEGVAKGQSDAESLIGEARRQSMEILDKTKQEADEMVRAAKVEAERTRLAGEEAIRLAGRDATLRLSEELRAGTVHTLKRLVGDSLKDTQFLRQLILEIAGQAVPGDGRQRMHLRLLNDTSMGEADEQADRALNQFARSLAGESLRDGLTFEVADSDVPGVRVQVVDDDLEIDLTTETLTHLLLKHLSPRIQMILAK